MHPVWVYDIHTEEMKETAFTMTHGFWIGRTETRDGSTIYVSTTNGQLYEFDVAHFGNGGNLWSGDVRLMAIEMPQSP